MPRYVIDERALKRNLEILKGVSDRTGVKILLAQKAYSCAATYPLCARYLAGTTASSLFEAKHGHDSFGGETHVFAPAFIPEEMEELLGLVDHIVFNSPRQIALYGARARARRLRRPAGEPGSIRGDGTRLRPLPSRLPSRHDAVVDGGLCMWCHATFSSFDHSTI